MIKSVSNYQFYKFIENTFKSEKSQKNLILEPLCVIFRLSLLQYKEKGTKLSVNDNSIQCQPPEGQGITRAWQGDCREDLHNLYHPILKSIDWYPYSDYKTLYDESLIGLRLLNDVYGENSTIKHTISHYISVIELNDSENFREDVEFNPAAGLSLERAPAGLTVEDMLVDGEVDAVLHPDLIDPILNGDSRVGRLFENYHEVELDYFRRTGIFPIMHVTAIRQELIDEHPWLPINLNRAFEASKEVAYKRLANPRVIPLAWFRSYLDEERELFGGDPWEYGLSERNRHNLETAIGYSHECGLISRKLSVDELFTDPPIGQGRERYGRMV